MAAVSFLPPGSKIRSRELKGIKQLLDQKSSVSTSFSDYLGQSCSVVLVGNEWPWRTSSPSTDCKDKKAVSEVGDLLQVAEAVRARTMDEIEILGFSNLHR